MSRPSAALALLIATLALGCPPAPLPPPTSPPSPAVPASPPRVVWEMSRSGLGFRLSSADNRDDRPPPPAYASPLSNADAKKVLDRLPPFKIDPGEQADFALRAASQPPPPPRQRRSGGAPGIGS